MLKNFRLLAVVGGLMLPASGNVLANTEDDFSLEDLMQVEVVSNTKFSQQLSDIPAAAYVISKEDIRMSGASNLPELLNHVPGLVVASASSNSWAVGSRGFAGVFANKLLVMIDGRSLFSPVMSGVFWEMHDIYLPDIKRIEVIRGSGSSTWGANAINGIINIITESSADTLKGHAYGRVGDHTKVDIGSRYGMELGHQAYARFYAKHKSFGAYHSQGLERDDSWDSTSFGGKADWFRGDDSWTLSADYTAQNVSGISILPIASSEPVNQMDNVNWNLSGAWQRIVSADNQFSLDVQLQEQHRDGFTYDLSDQMLNIEFDQTLGFASFWQFNYGISARRHAVNLSSPEVFSFEDEKLDVDTYIFSGYMFLQYKLDDNQSIELGTKLENHRHDLGFKQRLDDFDETYLLPNLRYINKLADNVSLWFSVNKSSRVPSISERYMDVQLFRIDPLTPTNPFPLPIETRFTADSQLGSEDVKSFELGLRSHVNTKLNLDLTLFVTDFDDIRATEQSGLVCSKSLNLPSNCTPDEIIIYQLSAVNGLTAKSNGLELFADWAAKETLNLKFSYTYLDIDFEAKRPDVVVGATGLIHYRHKYSTQAYWQATDAMTFKLAYKRMFDLQQASATQVNVESSIEQMDIMLAYDLSEEYRLEFEVRNLFNDEKREWFAESPTGFASNPQQELRIGLEVLF